AERGAVRQLPRLSGGGVDGGDVGARAGVRGGLLLAQAAVAVGDRPRPGELRRRATPVAAGGGGRGEGGGARGTGERTRGGEGGEGGQGRGGAGGGWGKGGGGGWWWTASRTCGRSATSRRTGRSAWAAGSPLPLSTPGRRGPDGRRASRALNSP